MARREFSIEQAIAFGWMKVKSNLRFFIPLGVIVFVAESLPRWTGTNRTSPAFISFLAAVFYWLLRTLIDMGVIKIALKFVDGKKAAFSDLLSESDLLWDFILGSIVYSLIVLAGLILFIIPGIIWAIKYSYFSYLIIDKRMSPMDSIKRSGEITRGRKWHLCLFGLSLFVINILGALCLLVGLFITLPVSYLAWAHVYRQISSKS